MPLFREKSDKLYIFVGTKVKVLNFADPNNVKAEGYTITNIPSLNFTAEHFMLPLANKTILITGGGDLKKN